MFKLVLAALAEKPAAAIFLLLIDIFLYYDY